ncbi:MAG: TIGR04211 family SH3 domain-containing protein [Desulfobacter postgatei]|uniref:TIGR04211 family SH3 domain-containing protein n=1 Tax=Desulfobacter postgatei TaxID=2293 RepID=UPI0023F09343|nr:TIGR04211 family SH3 domain-containing protein [Desulfobacter postgatei]MDD4273576.1 TIGR04211 family SH3 domain-containing protein [Desulfobacter postgatei]
MMKLFLRICAVVLIVIGITGLCRAQTAYVSDMLILTFRKGPGPNYPLISALKSDTPLTIIEESNGYLKVALSSGEQGWVDKNYVVTDLPKPMIIDQLKKENAALEEKIRALTEQADHAVMEQLKKENQVLIQNLETLKSQYTALKAASATDPLEENKRLKTENTSLPDTLAQQKGNYEFMFKTGMIKWFLAGVGVLLLGWVIGLSVSSRQGGSSSLLD